MTQIEFFRARFESNRLGTLLFPILVTLVIPYLLIGIVGVGKTLLPVTAGAFPTIFTTPGPFVGGVPPWLSGLVICLVVLIYVFMGGSRGAAWANAFQTIVFMLMGVLAFYLIAQGLGGFDKAAESHLLVRPNGDVVQRRFMDMKPNANPVILEKERVIGHLKALDGQPATTSPEPLQPLLARRLVTVEFETKDPASGQIRKFEREFGVPWLTFLSYMLIPLSVGMFPHLFQHWLTARNAAAFKLTVVAHPICIMIVWVPCILIGIWGAGVLPPLPPERTATVLGTMVSRLVDSPVLTGFMTAGILAAIMSSLDSQFLCLGTMFTRDIVLHSYGKTADGKDRFSDAQIVWIARVFIVVIVALSYALAMVAPPSLFDLAVWTFTGFSSLFPLVFAALYWRRASIGGAYASIILPILTWLVFFHLGGYGGEFTVLGGVMPVVFCFAAGCVGMIGGSLLSAPPSPETVEKFFPESAAA